MSASNPRTNRDGRPLRVLLIGINFGPERTGIAPYSTSLARGLASRGIETRVLTTMPHYPEWRIPEAYSGWTRHERADGVAVTRLRHYVPRRPVGFRRLLSEVSFGARAVVARWHRPDVVLVVSPALFASAMVVLRARFSVRRPPTVVWTQDVYSLGIVETGSHGAGGAVQRSVTAVERYVARSSDAAVVIHDRFADLMTRMGAPPDRTRVIRNWSHLASDDAAPPRAEVRRLLGWGDDEIVALHTGNMGVKQDLGNLVEAARIARRKGARVRFIVMGNGSQRAVLERMAQGIDGIEFVDPLPDRLYLGALAAADVLVVNETAGLREMAVPSKLTSYFTVGRPVVAATDAESITAAEVLAARAGMRVDPAQPEQLVDAVVELASDPIRAAAHGASARLYRTRVLSEKAAFDAFESFLVEVAGIRSGGHAAAASAAQRLRSRASL